MDKTNILNRYKVNVDKLCQYGFKKINDTYEFSHDINSSLYAKFILATNAFTINVYDKIDDNLYLPFNVKNATGSYVASIKEEVSSILNDILSTCFISNDYFEKIKDIIKNSFDIEPEYLWEDDNVTCVFRNKQKKWFAIYMEISSEKLHLHNEEIVSIINVKCPQEEIPKIIDHINYFEAYHMNKKHWLTILLSNKTNLEEVKKLIINSYNLVNKTK